MQIAEKKGVKASRFIEAHVSSFENGFETYTEVRIIRIKSRFYNILLQGGYLPTMGEIDGDVSFLTSDDETFYRNIKGFYLYKANIFYLMINEE